MKVRPFLPALLLVSAVLHAGELQVSGLVNLRNVDNENARPGINKSALNQPLRIAGREFAHGVGTQVENRFAFSIGGATRFTAAAGVDDATAQPATVRFQIIADGVVLWRADLKKGDAAVPVDVDVHGRKVLELLTTDIGNAYTEALADWAEATFVSDGEAPRSVPPPAIDEPREILTPAPPAAPQINGPHVFGVRPKHPFLFTIAASGDRPIKYAAESLPDGLTLDAATGRITGELATPGSYNVTLHATNGRGTADGPLRIEVGERIALTPPLGWNSWNCWGVSVDQDKVLASARAMAEKGLINHGWTYINIDDTWQGKRTPADHALQANEKFPDMKRLCDEVHALGLKVGIYSTPWITSYAKYPGGSADNPTGDWAPPTGARVLNGRTKPWAIGTYSFAAPDANQWARWGIDYLKYDWFPNEPPETRQMAEALRASGRDIVYSLSNTAPIENAAALSALANSWRTTGDIHDSWGSLHGIWKQQARWQPFGRPGHWNDPDMLVVGDVDVGSGKALHPSRLTPNEQYTHISLWSLLSAPLLIGCPLERMDAFTMNLLTNDEVLDIDQDELGTPARQVIAEGRTLIYVKPLADGSRAVGLFNLAQEPQEITSTWTALQIENPKRVRDLWRQRDLPVDGDKVSAVVPRHGVLLLRVWSGK
jgi:alpha-galactosidase